MSVTKRLGLLAAIAIAVLGLTAVSASADEIESSGVHVPNATPGSGHVVVSLAAGTVVYVLPGGGGQVSCSTASGEGTITRETAPNAATTEMGNLEALSFTDGANPECDTTMFGISSCRTAVNGLPLMVNYREQGSPLLDELVVNNVELVLTCETITGMIQCHYTAVSVSGSITPNVGARNTAVFNDPLAGEASNSFICPGSINVVATLRLNREASAGGGQVMITE
jgi:hypothetical protein